MAVEVASAYVSLLPSARGFAKAAEQELSGHLADLGEALGKEVSDGFARKFTLSQEGLASGFGKRLRDSTEREARGAGERAGVGFKDSFHLGIGGIAASLGAAFAGVQVGSFLSGSIEEASSLSESISKVGVVFGDSAGDIQDWASTAATNLGQTQQDALEAAGTFGNLFSAMGIGTDVSAGMSKEIVGLASDLASFNNASPEDVLAALGSGLVGETEPLRRFGVNLNAARIEAEALRLGLVDSTVDQAKFSKAQEASEKASRKVASVLSEFGEGSEQYSDAVRDADQANAALAKVLEGQTGEMDAAAKAQAAYSLILADTSLAQGDFERTSDGLANQQRILAAQWDDLKARIGTALLPAVTTLVTALNDNLLPAFDQVSRVVGPLVDVAVSLGGAFASAFSGGGAADGLLGTFDQVGSVVSGIDFSAVLDGIGPAFAAITDLGGRIAAIDWAGIFAGAVDAVAPVVEGVAALVVSIVDLAVAAIPPLVAILGPIVSTVFPALLNVVVDIAGVVGPILGVALSALAEIFGFLADHADVLVPALAGAATAFVVFKTASAVTTTVGNVTSAIGILQSTAQTFGVSFSRAAFEAFKQTGPLTKLSTTFSNLKSNVLGAATAAKTHAKNLALQAKQIAITIANAVKAAAAWVAQKAALVASTIASKVAAVAQGVLNAVMSANPIFLVVAALAALGAALFIAYKKSETFRRIVDAVGRALRDAFFAVVGFITDKVVPAVVGFGKAFVNVVAGPAKFIAGTLIPAIVDLYRWFYGRLWAGIKAVAGFVVGTLVPAFASFVGVIADNIIPVIRAVVSWIADVAVGAFRLWVSYITDVLIPALSAIGDFIVSKVIPVIADVVGWIVDNLVEGFKTLASFVLDKVIPALGAVWSFIKDNVISVIADVVGWIVDHLVAAFKNVVDYIVGSLIPKFGELWDFLNDRVIPIFSNVATAIADFVTSAVDKIATLISQAKEKIDKFVGFFTGIGSRLTGAFDGIFDGLWQAFRSAFNLIIDGWNSLKFSIPSIDTGLPGVGKIGGFSVKVPRIEPLAHGGLISSPTLALIGENSRTTPEIVSPVETMREVVRDELDRTGSQTLVQIDKFVTQEPPRTMLEELQWRIAAGVL